MKERVCITVEPDLIDKAKELKINVSNVAEAALLRELDTFTKNAYTKALENQLELMKEFLKQKSLYLEFEEFKYGLV
jgi:post-segregation antitoxin (ccd killing protein)